MRALGSLKHWSDARRVKEYLSDEGIEVKIESEDDGWTIWLLDDEHLEIANSMFQAAENRIKKTRWKRMFRLDLMLIKLWSWAKNLLAHRVSLVLGGLAVLFLCIGYFQDLASFWIWGGKRYFDLLEFPLEGLAVIFVIIGLVFREQKARLWWTGKGLILCALLIMVSFGYNHLKWEGRLSQWEERRPDTKMFKEKFAKAIDSIRKTRGGLKVYTGDLDLTPPQGGKHVTFGGGIVHGGGGEGGDPIVLYDKEYADNPTMDKLRKFLKSDKTDRIEYKMGEFVCADFAELLHNQSEEKGIKCAYVTIDLGPTSERPQSEGHALVAFNPTDHDGLVFVDCTGVKAEASSSIDHWDRISYSLKKGETYRPKLLFPQNKYFSENFKGMGEVLYAPTIQW
jgi:hypothetical protein